MGGGGVPLLQFIRHTRANSRVTGLGLTREASRRRFDLEVKNCKMTVSDHPIPIVLPDECLESGSDSCIVMLPHPRTKNPVRILRNKHKLWELTAVDGSNPHSTKNNSAEASRTARSLLFDSDRVVSNPTVIVATPINPLYFVLSTLYKNRNKYLTAEYIEELGEIGLEHSCETLSRQIFEPYLPLVCETLDGEEPAYKLLNDKLIAYLSNMRDTIIENKCVPLGMYAKGVLEPLAPIDINATIPEGHIQQAETKVVMNFICSYLARDIAKLFMDSRDFTELDLHIVELNKLRKEAAITQQALIQGPTIGSKREAPKLERTSKKAAVSRGSKSLQKVDTTKNRSITDMFARKSM
jgi:hypothetical protein